MTSLCPTLLYVCNTYYVIQLVVSQQRMNSSLPDSQQSASGSSNWWFWVQQSFVTATTYGHLQQPDNSSVHYRGMFTLWTVLALMAPFIHKADLVIPPDITLHYNINLLYWL